MNNVIKLKKRKIVTGINCPAPCQVDSVKNKNILFCNQKQSVQFVQAALLLAVIVKHLLE